MSRLTLLNSQEREKVSIEGTQQNGWSARPSPALPRLSPVPLSSGLPKNLPFYDFILMAILEKDLWQQIISQSLLANFMVCSLTIAFNDQEHSADSAPQKHPSFRTRLQSKYPVLHWETHGLRTPNEGINQRYLKIWADVADKICFSRT